MQTEKRIWRDVPMPVNIAKLPRDARGLPIPYNVFIDPKGVAHFKVNDQRKEFLCLTEHRCQICGEVMRNGDSWMIGGQISAYHPQGAFNDPPGHYDCCQYALQVCPYMAYTQYKHIPLNLEQIAEKIGEDAVRYVDPTQDWARLDRLAFFCLLRVTKINVKQKEDKTLLIVPVKPYVETEYWRDGEQIWRPDCIRLLAEKGEQDFLPFYENYYLIKQKP